MIHTLLNTRYPILQGGMAHIATPAFAAACSSAGALGILASGSLDAEKTREAIRECRRLTDKPFGVNVMLMNPQAAAIVDVLCEEKPAVVTLGGGNAGPYIPRLKESGLIVLPVVSNKALALRLERAGADGLIVEGMEAGGHIGSSTTMALVPQIVDAVRIPVIAAGGIGDRRGFLAALALGAQGVQVGTCLLASPECPVHEAYKEAVLKARDSSTIVTGEKNHAPVRVLKNAMSSEYHRLEQTGATRDELERLTLGSLRRAVFEGDTQTGSLMMGQIAGLVHESRPVADIFADMCTGLQESLHNLQAEAGTL